MRTPVPRRQLQRIAIHDPFQIPKITACIQKSTGYVCPIVTELPYPKDSILAVGRTEHRRPPPIYRRPILRRRAAFEPVVLTIQSLERHGSKRICQMNDPHPLQISVRRQRAPQLRLEEREPDQDRIPVHLNAIHLYPLSGIPQIKDFSPSTILNFKIENDIVPIFPYKKSPPLSVPKFLPPGATRQPSHQQNPAEDMSHHRRQTIYY